MRKLKNIFISGILSVCMVVTSLPVELLAQEAETVQETETVQKDNGNDRQEDTQDKVQYELISFAELPESVKNQSVALGTDIEEIELPETLTALYRSFKEKPEDEKKPEENTGDKGGEKEPEDNTVDEDDEKEPEENSGDEDGENSGNEGGEKASEDNTGDEDEGTISEENPRDEGKDNESENNSDAGDNENESEGEGKDNESERNPEVDDVSQTPDEKPETGNGNEMTEVTSETKDGKSEAESAVSGTEDAGKAEPIVEQKTVKVHMREYNSQPEDMDAPKTLISESSEAGTGLNGEAKVDADSDLGLSEETKPESDSDANFSEETSPEADTNKDKNEGTVYENSIETIVIENVIWISMPEYDGDVVGSYIFTPVIAENYVLADGTALPEIIVTVGEAEDAELSGNEELINDVPVEPALGVISTNTTWTSGTLINGTVTIMEGVTLTIMGTVSIYGQVIIEGGGSIERGNSDAFLVLYTGKLTIDNIIIDGKLFSASRSMIYMETGSELILKGGCVIRNCVHATYVGGGAIFGRDKCTITLKDATIENCSAKFGGVIESGLGNLTLDNVTIENCSAESGGAIHSSRDNVTLTDTTIKNCSASQAGGAILVNNKGTLTLNNTRIENCSAHTGGAIDAAATVTLNNTTIENCSSLSGGGAINSGCTLILNSATIRNCSTESFGGGAICASIYETTTSKYDISLNNSIIEGCSAERGGGAILVLTNHYNVTINGGTYKNNSVNSTDVSEHYCGGGFISICSSTLKIYSGDFINNSAANRGGCIYNCGDEGTTTCLYGGRFEGNTCSNPDYSGGGAIFNSSFASGDTSLILSGSVEFVGDGQSSETDGIFLDSQNNLPRKLLLRDALSYPVSIHLNAKEGYVIAEGTKMDNGDTYTIKNRDMNKMSIYDTNGKMWYPLLKKKQNQVVLSATSQLEDVYFVYYINNGAEGLVEDYNNNDNGYKSGDTTTVQSADGLSWEDHEFIEWNTQADGSGKSYHPGDTLKITGDINLYAIYRETQRIEATFYSGGADQKKVESELLAKGANSVTITVPELENMAGWTTLGWNADKDSYTADIAAGTALKISDNTSYYGIYEKKVTLSYDANGGNTPPAGETGKCLANVHEEITYKPDGFEVAGEITADNPRWEFVGWNTKSDGTGDLYREGDIIKISEDTTLYATFETLTYAYFYSGSAGEYELEKTNAVTKKIIAPPLKVKSGWEEIGWDEDNDSYVGSIEPGTVFELTNDTDYYGVYKKEVTLSYSTLHDESVSAVVPPGSKKTRYANVHKEAITYNDSISGDPDSFEFDIASDISRTGYEFIGWNTREDGTGTFYRAADTDRNKISITRDTVLYAIFGIAPIATFYSGEAGQHKTIKGEFNYSVNATVTAPDLDEMDGWEPIGWNTDENVYSGSLAAGSVISLSENTSYYGIYKKEVELSYDANDWVADNPEKQRGFCYANVHEDITCEPVRVDTIPPISRAGYSFVGWSTSKDVTGVPMPDYYRPGESIDIEADVTLYAHMIDDILPVLGDASYNSGYTDIGNWLVRKKDLVITVPITEEGSGVNKIVYTLTPENGEPVTGEALMGEAYVPRQVRHEAVVQLDVSGRKTNVTSRYTNVNDNTDDGQNQSGAVVVQDTTAGNQPRATGGQVGITDGQIQARITISEDYKGTVTLKCLDNAGNESADKLLTATGGGVIVEDNAPQINFTNKDIKNSEAVVTVSVSDDVDTDKNSQITGGIASVTYQIDDKQEQNITTKNFDKEIVSSCEFSVDISGSGEHTLKVTAIDNAGNESQQSTQVSIEAENKKTTVIKQKNSNPPAEDKNEFVPLVKADKPELKSEPPKNSEPATGDNSMRVEVYATIAMIAGLLYILLYFITGNNGMTEEDKNETVSRILNWAKKGGRCRKFVAIAAIFCVLFYYHSIGKRVNVEWNEVAAP